MKKLLLIILLGFLVVSIVTILFTIQYIPTFRNFDDEDDTNGDNNDDHYSNLPIVQLNQDTSTPIFLEYEASDIIITNYSKCSGPFYNFKMYCFLNIHRIN